MVGIPITSMIDWTANYFMNTKPLTNQMGLSTVLFIGNSW